MRFDSRKYRVLINLMILLSFQIEIESKSGNVRLSTKDQ
jgi:hypothetical protein